ncbi:hypothetical protein FQA39_LY19386 [Lamprigera yunnana]|nr:hypothetical protein FQA39_LY19386 [Lamprigera yunnana]
MNSERNESHRQSVHIFDDMKRTNCETSKSLPRRNGYYTSSRQQVCWQQVAVDPSFQKYLWSYEEKNCAETSSTKDQRTAPRLDTHGRSPHCQPMKWEKTACHGIDEIKTESANRYLTT